MEGEAIHVSCGCDCSLSLKAVRGLQNSLQKGSVPAKDAWEWPAEPFQSKFKSEMINLEMPRFCRNYPKLTDALLRDMLGLVQVRPATLLRTAQVGSLTPQAPGPV